MWASLQGEMGSIVFVDAPGGTIAREHVAHPRKSESAAAVAARARFGRVATFWNSLTDSQQDGWDAWAIAQGRGPDDPTAPTGYQKYAGLANLWLQANNNTGTPPVAPPASAFNGSPVTVSAVASANTITFTGSAALPANVVAQYEIQPLKRASRKPSKTGWRVKALAAFVGPGNTYAVTVAPGPYVARYSYVNRSTGQRTAFIEIPVTGVALSLEDGGAAEAPVARAKKAA